ncbi:hypothetical protein FRB96_003130 [Tulasnella sp. 330]|nr:hypothetical protein FRB96_003130 [Tulasnella sp. 330]KAG8875522.1 hypothetical protein FRB97_005041 [Tulasnella sp. 331]KAG8880027.1 hypothetical protein FRB98_005360 [Tulasnella sp. 332]
MARERLPDLKAGLAYWENTPATLDGVLGGFGSGTLPRVDALGSRQFLQSLLPYLCTVNSALRPLEPPQFAHPSYRTRTLDVGAGIGRVTSNVLLHLFDDVVLLEPVEAFVQEAKRACREGKWKGIKTQDSESTKSVTFLTCPLQSFDPTKSAIEQGGARLGSLSPFEEGYDVVWCQWTLGHLSDADLVTFFQSARKSLRKSPTTGRDSGSDGLIVVKENIAQDYKGKSAVIFDEDDSSVTR